ncbi:valine--tRNA ligase [Patescibacteria group bacterium]|nr:valine--tRNA ligase [Patescibacteria group bacterium]
MKDKLQIPKAYDSSAVEDNIYADWEKSGFFNPDNLPGKRTDAFSIILPPPNVTGVLHMGHAIMLAIEDAMIRFARMQGKKTLWLPGTDHAAIATQSKVEKILMEESGQTRHDLGREAFLEKVDAFAAQSHKTITNQMKKMGASVDWSREAYTLDENRQEAVQEAFVRMFEDGLIYRGHRVVNWDPKGGTTVSDDEVEYEQVEATLYTFKYSPEIPMAISTTRPETKVGDTAIAVHPDDDRYKDFIGKTYDVDFAGTKLHLIVVADKEVDPDFGTGALGVTPAHSVVDSEIASRHNLPLVQVIDKEAKMTTEAGSIVSGMTTLEARDAVVKWLRTQKLLISEEIVEQNLSVAQRSGGSIEPLPMDQWFIDVNKKFAFKQSARAPIDGLEDGQNMSLKEIMQYVVREKQIKIMPEKFEKVYFKWVDNLRDWNISRQLWFGHRMPVWYRGNELHVEKVPPKGEGWEQDSDTLDTWFSSGLWTFSTLGWPNETQDLSSFHPIDVLETGYDILFFWVARMILMSTYFLGEVPFKTVYLHGLVRDEKGRKMSKSLGNAMDPLHMIERYGADATRLSLLIGQSPGNDLKISDEKVAGFRNFTNKLWNISRFVFMGVDVVESISDPNPQTLADRWILGRLAQVNKKVTSHCEAYEYSVAGEILRDFTWNDFADWYIEVAKIEGGKDKILLFVLEAIMKMWHPFMPFVTEEVYKKFEQGDLIVAQWPEIKYKIDESDDDAFEVIKDIVTAVRAVRANYKIDYKKEIDIVIDGILTEEQKAIISRLARVGQLRAEESVQRPGQSAVVVLPGMQIFVPLAGIIDVKEEAKRLEKELSETKKYLHSLEAKLLNKEFVKNAPRSVVEKEEEKKSVAFKRIKKLEENLTCLA